MAVQDALSSRLSMRTRRRIARLRVQLRAPTGPLRILPGLLIVGAQRAGTSSLYRWLGRHPQVAPSLRKETDYFSFNFTLGFNWYRAHFPLRDSSRLGFEASPTYLLHPDAAARARAALPDARVIALVRNPVDRAFSHHRHMTRLGFETLDFEAALDAEPERIAGELERIAADPAYDALPLRRCSYVYRGRYASQLERWRSEFPAEQLLVVASDDLYRQPAETFTQVLDFLGLRREVPADFVNASRVAGGPTEPIPDRVRARLVEEFRADNDRLYVMLGRDLGWS